MLQFLRPKIGWLWPVASVPQSRFWHHFFVPVDIAALVYFRIAFGLLMFWEVRRYFAHGWIERYWVEPGFHFTYYGFAWLQPWPGNGMVLHFLALGLLALFITFGFWYRLSTVLFFLGFTYVFLLDQATYLNHFYLISLLSFLLIFVPAHRALSSDTAHQPKQQADTAPAWTLWLLRAQLGIVYFYGGIAKINADWLRGEPLRAWLAVRTDFPLLGPFFSQEWLVYLFSYGALFLDLLIVPLLLWRRTRLLALLSAVVFHLLNARLFNIGIFPWFMIAATLLFLPPNWFRLRRWWPRPTSSFSQPIQPLQHSIGPWLTLILIGFYLSLQLLLPLRHFLYPGNVNWTEEGHRFAWHMKLRSKQTEARFYVTNPASGQTWQVRPEEYLSQRQAQKMPSRPDMILQFSHYLADVLGQDNQAPLEVRAWVTASLNGREPQLLIDPKANLAAEPRDLRPASWILPLEEASIDAGAKELRGERNYE